MGGQMPNRLPMLQVRVLGDIQAPSGFSPEQAAAEDSSLSRGVGQDALQRPFLSFSSPVI